MTATHWRSETLFYIFKQSGLLSTFSFHSLHPNRRDLEITVTCHQIEVKFLMLTEKIFLMINKTTKETDVLICALLYMHFQLCKQDQA